MNFDIPNGIPSYILFQYHLAKNDCSTELLTYEFTVSTIQRIELDI